MSGATGFSARLWHEPLTSLGFRAAGAAGIYHCDDLVFAVDEDWGVLRSEWRAVSEDPLQKPLEASGLWKTISDPLSGDVQAVWETPPTVLTETDPRSRGDEGLALFRDALAWGLETASGKALADWAPPGSLPAGTLAASEALSLRAGHLLRQGTLVREPGRLALRFPVLPRPAAPLPASRAAWLTELLLDAQRRWCLVRFHEREDGAVDAAVDLTGVPAALAGPFLQAGLEALRAAVESLIRESDFLASSSVSRALEVLSPRAKPAQPVR